MEGALCRSKRMGNLPDGGEAWRGEERLWRYLFTLQAFGGLMHGFMGGSFRDGFLLRMMPSELHIYGGDCVLSGYVPP